MLHGHWDESGMAHDPACKVVALAGLIADTDGWLRFEPAWQAMLDEFHLPYLHMKDFAHWRGAFADRELWTEARRRELMQRALTTIALAKPHVHGAVLDLDAWRSLPQHCRDAFLDPWFCCLQEVARIASVYCVVEGERVGMVFSQQKEFAGTALRLWSALRERSEFEKLGAFMMDDMRHLLPLQAADLVTYEVAKLAPTILNASNLRFPLRALLEIDPNAFVANINSEYLQGQCEGAE